MLGALRWHLLVRGDDQLGPRYSASLACYWRSLAVGVVTPGSIGADACRVLALGVQTQRYLRAVLLIVVEKLAAALACILIVALLLPLIQPIVHVPPWVGVVVLALVIGVIVILASALRRPQGWLQKVARVIYQRLSAPIQTWQLSSVAEQPSSLNFVVAPKLLAGVLAASVAVFLVSALQAQLFFCAIGHDIAYRVNLFAAPLFFLVFTLPISFGTLGVREAAYIGVYGLFGVPAEDALVVSLSGLVGLLSSYTIGALLLLRQRRRTVHH